MRIVKTRPGRVGTLATLILMFSIVLFAGTLFWLITDTGFITGNPETGLYKSAVPDDIPWTLNQTITALQDSGCMVLYYSKEYAGGYEQVSFQIFMKEAVAARIAYRIKNPDNRIVLLVEVQGRTLEWVPEG
jgi:hypothetical protein